MGVHDDNLESKYGVINKSSSFSKLAPKRPGAVIFHDKPNKLTKNDDPNTEVNEKTRSNILQQRKQLPVNRIRKKYFPINVFVLLHFTEV